MVGQATKKKLLIGIVSVAGALLLAVAVWFLLYTLQFGVYKDNTYRFSIKYPKKWQMTKTPQPGVAVIFVTPKESVLDVFQENVNITVEDVPPDIATLKSFSDKVIAQMTAVFGNIKAQESKAAEFGNRRGYRVLFTTEKPDKMNILTTWTIKGGRAYILMYMAAGKKYETYRPYVEDMIKSFEFR